MTHQAAGEHPIYHAVITVNCEAMRTKTVNGPSADLEKLLEDLKVVVKDGQELLKSGWGGVRQRAITGARTTDQTVREHPYQTIGVVFGLGIMIGLLFSGMLAREEESEVEE
jgi:ElaB/YqjD/DUF883 family membrane-anchored ribosome-binding protein